MCGVGLLEIEDHQFQAGCRGQSEAAIHFGHTYRHSLVSQLMVNERGVCLGSDRKVKEVIICL